MEDHSAKTDDSACYNGGINLMNSRMMEITDEYVKRIMEQEEYIAYSSQVRAIQKYPELMEKINAYREENFRIQNEYEGDELYDRMEEFANRNEQLTDIPIVQEFLSSEAAFCRLMQEINIHIMEGLNFQ